MFFKFIWALFVKNPMTLFLKGENKFFSLSLHFRKCDCLFPTKITSFLGLPSCSLTMVYNFCQA